DPTISEQRQAGTIAAGGTSFTFTMGPPRIANADFESGTLDGWKVAPRSVASAVQSLGPGGTIRPWQGKWMGFLSTAGNAPTPPGISPGVTLTPGHDALFPSGVNILGSELYQISSSVMTHRVCSSFAIPADLHGTAVTLRFEVGDALDTNVDSAVLIDVPP